jgi:alpha-1,6-mannosyltransferase
MRIVRLANFVMARSGGLRTALHALGRGYLAEGHESVLVMPGERFSDEITAQGRVITVRGPAVWWSGGYRVMVGRRRLTALLTELAPDRLEVSDRFTLRWTGRWARENSVPSIMVSHESLFGLLGETGLSGPPRQWLADVLNARTARHYDQVLCTTEWASEEFRRLGLHNLVRVPLGVDLETFYPTRHDPSLRAVFASAEQSLLVHCGRLSPEKRPWRSVDTLAALRDTGVDAVLVMAGDGPLRESLRRRAADLPVHFADFVADKPTLAKLLATADVVLAPGPVETFGLAALEAMACGTPVVVDATSALPEIVGDAGVAVFGEGEAFAEGVRELLGRPATRRRAEARRRAERFDWGTAVAGFLRAHGLGDGRNAASAEVSASAGRNDSRAAERAVASETRAEVAG